MAWTNPAWNGKDPGAFALIIGVSHYDHLPGGGKETAPETYGLPQLQVCAVTAFRVFQWLRDHYVSDGVSLAKCWILLSPTPEEVAFEPDTGDWPRPTFAACESAVAQWFGTMRSLLPDSADLSRSFFFFTGHGLELHQNEQILLPCDYLEPPVALVDRALSTRNLQAGLAGLSVPVQLFFIDACRNDHSRFREDGQQLTGRRVLNEKGAAWARPNIVAPVLYATTTGAQAFQPTSVQDGLSIFGQALLEGVSEPPAEIRDCDPNVCHVGLFDLMKFLARRVPELLADYGSTASQPVRLGGSSSLVCVTDVAATAPARGMPPDVAATSQRLLSVSADLPSTDWGKLDETSGQAPDVFGEGSMAGLWAAHTLSTETGEPARHQLVLAARHEVSAYRLLIRVPDAPVPTVFRASDDRALLSCRLPALGRDTVLRLDAADDDRGGWNLSVGVDPSTPGILGEAAGCWFRYAEGDVPAALREVNSFVEAVLEGRSSSPLPALVAALVQLRANSDRPLPWLEDLALLYPAWPDFRILQGENKLRRVAAEDVAATADAALAGYKLPFTTEALGYAATHALAMARQPDELSPAAVTAAQDIAEAVSALQPGGLFCVMSNPLRP
jgi:hypothetical protein